MLSIENLFCRLCVLEEIDGRVSEGFKLILSQRYLSPLPKIKQTKKTLMIQWNQQVPGFLLLAKHCFPATAFTTLYEMACLGPSGEQ